MFSVITDIIIINESDVKNNLTADNLKTEKTLFSPHPILLQITQTMPTDATALPIQIQMSFLAIVFMYIS